jgi:hypothetical protein
MSSARAVSHPQRIAIRINDDATAGVCRQFMRAHPLYGFALTLLAETLSPICALTAATPVSAFEATRINDRTDQHVRLRGWT